MGKKLNENQIEELTAEILELKESTAINIMEIGKRLIQIKYSLPHGKFIKYLEEKVDYTSRTAQKFIKVYEEFGNTKSPSLLSTEKLYLLTGLKKEQREEFLQNNDVEHMSTRELQQVIKDTKKANKKALDPQKTDSNVVINTEFKDVTESINVNKNGVGEKDTIEQNLKFEGQVNNGTPVNNEEVTESDSVDEWAKTISMVNEIKLKTGGFYNDINSNLQLSDYESLLVTRYLNGEVTQEQYKSIIDEEKLNIPYMQNEESYKKFLDDLSVSNSYRHYVDNYDSKNKIDNSYYYCNILEIEDLSYENVIEFAWEKNLKDRQKYINENKYVFTLNNITIAMGYIESTEYICIYKDRELFAHYDTDYDYLDKITELFKFYKINKKYLKLVEKFMEQKEIDRQQQLKDDYNKAVKVAKIKLIKNDETYLLSEYGTQRDCVRVFRNYEEIAFYAFEVGMNLYNTDFYNTVSIANYYNELIKDADKKHIVLVYLKDFHKLLRAEAKKIYDKYKKDYEEYDPFRDYKKKQDDDFWEQFASNFNKKQDASLDMFTEEELQFLKDMLQDEDLWKKVYRKTAIKNHPDRAVIKGQEAVKEAENLMKLLNSINEKIVG
ncbi:DUF3102 domain-containing protein [Clostridium sp. DJ247]|uniref:DUF3102 domain-containing protein n=1 Tax=Clostridium sp. DJ247 TaxID=2726188 RepID=UPI001623BDB2|nr:DUF3102 domain-containing protein [Clostridium sp. DJ247]MBC2579964.1 DUF3102 domain-containing protein [Clostridium sp. DJ247]